MSQDSSGQEKSEEATPRKLRKSRERGQVARSTDIPSTVILVAAVLYLMFTWKNTSQQLAQLFSLVPQLYTMDFNKAVQIGFKSIVIDPFINIALPFSLVMLAAGIIGNVVQFGFLFAIDPIIPKPEKVNPADGFKRIFSARQLTTTLLAVLKTFVMVVILVIVLYMGLKELLHEVSQCDVICQKTLQEYLLRKLVFYIIPFLIIIAVLDYIYQRAQFLKEQKMTKEEVKRENKEMYGDPHIRGARQDMRREMAEMDIKKRISTARLLILDMGVAIALQYEQGKTPLPVIAAIGKGAMARKMVEIASVENVTMVINSTLAKELVAKGKVDQYIPDETVEAVAVAMRQTMGKT